MTNVPGNNGASKTINLVALKDPVSGTVPAICVKIDRDDEKLPTTSQEYDDGNVLSPSALATCRTKYPSGCTIVECRLDSCNRPVAQVVQVPGDVDAISQKMSVVVEAKQTPCGPYSRVKHKRRNGMTPKTCTLQSGDTCKKDNVNKEAAPKVLCGTMMEEAKEDCNKQQTCQESPKIFVQCEPMKGKQFTDDACKPQEVIYRSPPNCEDTCPGARRYVGSLEDRNQTCLPMERKNGLDPTDSELKLHGCFEKSMRKQNRVCPVKCCKPIERCEQEKRKPPICPDSIRVSKKCSKDMLPVSPSQDSLERYKDFVSPSMLEKYRSCRSKRNGLQDECYLPLPRAFLESEKAQRERDYFGDDCRNLEKNESGVIRTKSEISRKADQTSNRVQQVQSSQRKSSKPASTGRSSQKSVNKKRRRLKRVKSRELHAGQVFIDCDCYHRNGLQHDCPRTLCGGEPCMEKPLPKCDLGTYFLEKWDDYYDRLDRLMPTAFSGTEEQWLEEYMKRRYGKVEKDDKSINCKK